MTHAANEPFDTTKRPVSAKCDKCGQLAFVVAPDFALCEEHGRAVIAALNEYAKEPQ